MSSEEFSAVVILYPKKGETDTVVGLLKDIAKYTEAKEHRVIRYEVNRVRKPAKDGTEDVVMIESYKDKAALQEHGSSEIFTKFLKTLDEKDLIRAPMTVKLVTKVGGFSSRL